MEQAYQLEVACSREKHDVILSIEREAAIHTCTGVEGRPTGRSSWTTDRERRTYLSRYQKAHGVRLVSDNVPGNAVSSVHPHFIGQKGHGLPSLAKALAAYRSLPRLRLY